MTQHVDAGRSRRASIAASAPSSAAISTPTWRFTVVAEPVDEFQAWLQHQRQPAREPPTEATRSGTRRLYERHLRDLPHHSRQRPPAPLART